MIVDVERAAAHLRDGGVIAYPTETVYGLGADATRAGALERLRELKGRDDTSALSVLIADLDALEAWLPGLPERARSLARRFWPGPLTLVLGTAEPRLAGVASPRGVGFRCSPQPTARALAAAAGPIVSTSANRSGEPPCVTASEVARTFGADLPIAGGEPAGGLPPSTVVAVADGEAELLRAGPVGWDDIVGETGS